MHAVHRLSARAQGIRPQRTELKGRAAMKAALTTLILLAATVLAAVAQAQTVPAIDVPRKDLFHGATNPAVTPESMSRNICKDGWSTASIRPRTSYTTALKQTQLHSLEDSTANTLPLVSTKSGKARRPDLTKCVARSANLACYEEDHLISLELGGHPTSPENLWPEPWFGEWNAKVKDHLENRLHEMVCHNEITLRDAQTAIATDWIAAYRKYVGDTPSPAPTAHKRASATRASHRHTS